MKKTIGKYVYHNYDIMIYTELETMSEKKTDVPSRVSYRVRKARQ